MHQETIDIAGAGVRLAGTRWLPTTGRGRETLLFLHGGGQTRHSWGATAARLASLGWTAVTMDTRGHGDSGWPANRDYTMDVLVDDLRRAIDELPKPPVLVGASLGGMTALLLEGEAPGTTRALVLVDVVPRLEPEGVRRVQDFMGGRPKGFATLEEAAEAVRQYAPNRTRPVNVDGLRKNLRLGANGRWYWHWDPAFLAAGDQPRLEVAKSGRLDRAAAAITVPTLLVHGRQSDVISHDGIDEFQRQVPHAEVADVSDAGHMVAGDDNDVFMAHLAGFLERLPLRDASVPGGHGRMRRRR